MGKTPTVKGNSGLNPLATSCFAIRCTFGWLIARIASPRVSPTASAISTVPEPSWVRSCSSVAGREAIEAYPNACNRVSRSFLSFVSPILAVAFPANFWTVALERKGYSPQECSLAMGGFIHPDDRKVCSGLRTARWAESVWRDPTIVVVVYSSSSTSWQKRKVERISEIRLIWTACLLHQEFVCVWVPTENHGCY